MKRILRRRSQTVMSNAAQRSIRVTVVTGAYRQTAPPSGVHKGNLIG